jgi:hypothetical protein
MIEMGIATESRLLVGRLFPLAHRLAPPERLRVLPHQGLARSRGFQVPPKFPEPGAPALLPVPVRLQCQHAVHHPGALPSLRSLRKAEKKGA